VRNSSGLGFYRGIDLGFYRGIDMALAKVTIDYDETRKWAEARDGRPAAARSTQSKDGPG
jgi:hypothetical protein